MERSINDPSPNWSDSGQDTGDRDSCLFILEFPRDLHQAIRVLFEFTRQSRLRSCLRRRRVNISDKRSRDYIERVAVELRVVRRRKRCSWLRVDDRQPVVAWPLAWETASSCSHAVATGWRPIAGVLPLVLDLVVAWPALVDAWTRPFDRMYCSLVRPPVSSRSFRESLFAECSPGRARETHPTETQQNDDVAEWDASSQVRIRRWPALRRRVHRSLLEEALVGKEAIFRWWSAEVLEAAREKTKRDEVRWARQKFEGLPVDCVEQSRGAVRVVEVVAFSWSPSLLVVGVAVVELREGSTVEVLEELVLDSEPPEVQVKEHVEGQFLSERERRYEYFSIVKAYFLPRMISGPGGGGVGGTR